MAAKFVSPFVSDSETAAVDNDDDLTQLVIPDDTLSFNDSLDEGVDLNALADHAVLPAESAAAEPTPQDGNSYERPNRDLNDSLDVEDGNETQLTEDIAVTANTTDADGVLTGRKVTQVEFSPNANSTCDVKKSDSSPQDKQPSSESASSKDVGIKMKPSFGKKKKAFVTPKMAQKVSSATTAQPNCVSGQSGSDGSNKNASQKYDNAELADTSEDQSALGDNKTPATTSSAENKGSEKVTVKVIQALEKNEEYRKAETEKKKGFTPPKVAKKVLTKCQSDINTQPSTIADHIGSDNCNSPQVPESNVGKQTDSTKEKSLVDAGNGLTPSTGPKAGEKGEKKQNKNVLQEQRKNEKERERAQKKQEKEQKKLNREKKKAEVELQREEKRLELERKKAEREQKKIDRELKKIEREKKKAEKLTKQDQKRKQSESKLTTDASDSDGVKKNSKDEPCKSKEDVREVKSSATEVEATIGKKSESSQMNSEEVSCGLDALEDKNQEQLSEVSCVSEETKPCSVQESKYPKVNEVSKSDPVKSEVKASGEQQKETTNEVEDLQKENVLPDDVQNSANNAITDYSPDKIPVVVLSPVANNFSETSGSEMKKEKAKSVKKFNPPMSKQEVNTKSNSEAKRQRKERGSKRDIGKSSETKKKQAGKGKKRKSTDCDDEPEAKRSIPANYHGPVWVQCENSSCMKWRLLKDCDDPATVPSSWVCSMNSDPDHNSCSAEEERWSDPGDSQEFVESPYIPGSIVWSKMDGYPWWPAMVEEDPNDETYYEMGYRDNPIPVKYHVVFFDTPVCRGWVSSLHVLPFTGQNDPNKDNNVNIQQKHRRSLTEGRKQANRALKLTARQRLDTLGFATRFRGNRKRKHDEDSGSPEVIPSRVKRRGPVSRETQRKTARLTVNCEESTSAMDLDSKQDSNNFNTHDIDDMLNQHEE